MRKVLLWLAAISASVLYGQQALDNTGNSYLNGSYFFRWVTYSGLDSRGVRQATAAYGTIRFDGAGTYRIEGRIAESTTAPVTSRPFAPTGRYTVSASGMAEIENPIFPGDTLYAGVGPAGVVGSSTGHGNHDLFIAIPSPASSVTNGNLAGVYRAATFDFLHGSTGSARDAFLSLQADGKGNFAPFAPAGSSADGLAASGNQTVTGATYSLAADGSGTAAFPLSGGNADAQLVAGDKIFFLSSDGETFIAGSPTGFDLMVGIRALSGEAANAAYRGLYYTASIQHDVRSTPYHQSLQGARNVQAASTWYQERINAAPDIPANHYDGTDTVPLRPFDSDGVYRDTNFYRVAGTGGRIFFEVGRGNFYELYLGVRAHPVAGGGSFLSPYGVVNGANFQPATNPIAPGEIVSLFGSGFATSSANASSLPLPTTLGDVQVKINGRPAPLLSVGPEQINLVVPHATTEPYASVQVFVSGRPLKAAGAYTRATAPGVFTIPPGGTDGGAVLHADYSLVSETSGARPGETVMAFVTGLGAVTPALADGAAAPATPFSVVPPSTKVSVYVGGIPAAVSFAGLAPGFAGLYQLNFRIPDNIGAVFPKGDSGSAFAPVEVGTADGATLTRLRVDPRSPTEPKALAASTANTAPTADPQAISTSQNASAFIHLTATDVETPAALSTYASRSSAPHGAGSASGLASAVLTFAVVSHPAHGTLTGTPPDLVYTPAPNYAGPDNFQFTATDRGNPENCGTPADDCATPLPSLPATVSITVLPVNTRPSANSQTAAVSAGAASAITLAGSDAETPADLLSFAVITAPAHGTLSGIAPNLTYRPTPGYSGPDSFQFTVTDRGQPDNCGAPSNACAAALTSGAGTVSINVGPLNTAPAAISQSLAGAMATPLSFTLTGSDAETPANALVFRVVSQPQDGSLTVNGSSVIYTPNSGFHGEDSFRFTVTDGGSPDNCGAPSAACAPPLTSNPAVVSISISGPAPAVNTAPQAHAQTVTTNENTAKAIVLTGADAETPAANLAFAVTVNPAHGSLSGTAPNLTYTPAPDYIGADSFQFKSIDRGNPDACGDPAASCAAPRESAPATVSITVVAVNTAPVAAAQAVTLNEGAAKAITLAGTDAETAAASLAFAVTTAPAHGTLTGTAPNVTYTPAAGYFGPDSFQFTVTDRGNPDSCGATGNFCSAPLTSAPGLVSLTVVPVNTAPTATAQNVAADENGPKTITLAGTDTETPAAGLSFTVTGNPAHGTLTGTAPNLTYTPAANYIGPDSFLFTVTDRGKPDNCGASGSACAASLTSAAATVTITVRAVNRQPGAIAQSAVTSENTAKAITLAGSDAETATANLVFAVTTTPAHGTLSGTAPNLTYSPAAGYFGPDAFQFTVTDRGNPDNCGAAGDSCAAALTSAPGLVTLTVVPVNSAPAATAQSVNADQNAPKTITLAGTDAETASAALSFAVTANPAHGTLTGTAPNLTYTPAANYVGPDSFQFTVTDRGKPDNCGAPGNACAAALTSAAATVSITVRAANTTPSAIPQSASTNENTAKAITLVGADSETAAANLVFAVTAAPAHGTLSGTAPNLTYTPNAGYSGPDSFQFTVTDRGAPDNCGAPNSSCAAPLTSSAATVTLAVIPVNSGPTATPQSITANENAAKAVTLAGTDTETPSGNLSFTVTASPAHGTLTGTAPNLTYTPAANYIGPDSFQFTVTDRGKPDNCGAPGDACAAALTSTPATVTITVQAVNTPPVANALGAVTNENVAIPINLTASDAETAPANLTFIAMAAPAHGIITGSAPNLVYTPLGGFFGVDAFQFKVRDLGNPDNCGAPGSSCAAALESSVATVTITVVPVNTAPAATAQSIDAARDSATAITLAGTDAETAPANLAFNVTANPAHGTLSGTAPNLTYTPAANYTGPDSFQFTVTDRGKPDNCGAPNPGCSGALTSAAATVSITVAAVNRPPVANPLAISTNESTAVPVPLTGSDTETAVANLTFTVTTPPSHGTLSGAAPNLTYTPAPGYFGPDSFQFKVTDRGAPDNCGAPNPPACLAAVDSAPATVSITVAPVNTAPVATGQSVTTNQDTQASILIAGTDAESATLSFTLTSGAAHGTLTGTAPNLTYTPNAGYFGPDSFQFTVTDGGKPDNCGSAGSTCATARSSAAATVTITVVPVNTAPTAAPQSINTNESTAKAITLTGSDLETAPANLSFAVTTGPSHGSLSGVAPNLTYTPAAGYFGPDSFQFTVTDLGHPDNCGAAGTACAAARTSSAATVSIIVSPLNTPPAAASQALSANQNAGTPVTLAGTDTETAAASLSFTITTGPSHGVLTGLAPNLTYTPTSNYVGPDSFQFTVTDRGKPDGCGVPGAACGAMLTSAPATVSIMVVAANTPPTAGAQSVTTAESAAAGITLSGTDSETTAANLSFAVTVNPSHGTLAGTAPNLTYTPDANYNGADSFQFTVTDRGSPDSCGTPGPSCAAAMTSAPAMVSITVTPLNSLPAAAGQSVSTNEDMPLPITLSGSDIETAPASLTYTITQPPAHGALSGSGGSLTYTPAANYNGTDSFRFTVTDRGDPDNCGSPGLTCAASFTSAAATVSITVNAVNDPPSLGVQAYSAVANMKIVLPSGSLLAGAADPDAADAGFSPVLTVVAGSPATTPGGGAVAIAADGSFSFDPPPGVTGNVTFPYQVCDNGNPMPSQCATGLVTVNVSGPVIWFVAPNLGSNGTGTLASPFNTLAPATAAAGTNVNHRIFVYNSVNQAAVVSTAPGAGVTLNAGQWLAGQSVVAPSFDTFMGITPPVTTVARPLVNGAATTIQGTVTLSGNDGVVRGVTIQPPAGAKGLVASGPFTGLIAGSGSPGDVAVSTVNARAVDLSGGLNGTFVFKSISVSGGSVADNGIVLSNVNNTSGSFAVTGDAGSLNNSSGGTIQNTVNHAVSLTNTKNVSFDQMNIQAPGDSGVNGTAITNLAFTNGTVANAGTAGYESAIALNGSGSGLGNNINGALTVTGNTFINPYYSGLDAQSDAGTVTVADISNNVITNPGYIGVNLVGTGNAATSFSVLRATINQNNISSAGTGVQVNIGNSNASGPGSIAGSLATPADIISITNNSITIDPTGTQSIIVANSGGNGWSRSRTNFVIRCNGTNTGGCTAPTASALNGSSIGTVIGIGNNGYSDMTGTVDNNVIDANHTPGGGGGSGIGGGNGTVLGNADTPNLTLTVTNNTITRTDGNGILLVGRGTSGFANLKIAGNNVGAPLGGARPGIRVDAGNASSLDDGVCLNIAGNTSAGSGGVAGIGVRKQGTLPDTNDFGLFNIPQVLPTNDDVTTFINGTNTSTGGALVISGSGFKRCTTAPF